MKIILAVDGSPNSEDAAGFITEHKWAGETNVRVLTVVENIPPRAFASWHGSHGVLEEMRREETADAKRLVERVAGELQTGGVTAEAVVRHGDPRTVIVEEAVSWSADLIVVGAQGYTGLAKFFMGSVAQAIVSSAPCSVLVVRRKLPAQS